MRTSRQLLYVAITCVSTLKLLHLIGKFKPLKPVNALNDSLQKELLDFRRNQVVKLHTIIFKETIRLKIIYHNVTSS